ncbi:MAG: sulfite exporter TauE/SafE family protein [Candidatus Omnitrophica bacterium]|nr:sulfite exporter TauE/SafE family protein [Candidatus Omnitrophota bacterium]
MNLSGNPFDYVLVFCGGVLLSLTPCVYPLIPVSVGYITAKSGSSKLKSFLLSLVYVSGIAVTYSILGLIASLTGMFFGKISVHPITQIAVGTIIIIFGIMMWFDLFSLFYSGVRVNSKRRGYLSTFILGLSSGLVISPCLTPALGSILAYLATKKNVFYGMSLLLTFAYGMGLILILAGTFSSILANLPKSGIWLVYIKRISSLILICIGLYFIYQGIRSF